MPKRTNLKTSIGVVLDESGSMHSRAEETRVTFNKYFDDIQESDPEALVTVGKFSDLGFYTNLKESPKKIRFLCENVNVKDMPYLDEENYSPSGSTPLLDAVANGIAVLEREKADRYLLVIITDGLENASVEHKLADVQSMVKAKEDLPNWTIYFIGAGVDAWAGAQFIGMADKGKTFSYSGTAGTTRSAGQTVSAATQDYLSSGSFKAPDLTPPLTEDDSK